MCIRDRQKGMIPISVRSVEKALILNGTSVKENLKALQWGRWLAYDPQYVLTVSGFGKNRFTEHSPKDAELDYLIPIFSEKLTSYQNKNYAESYQKIMDAVKAQFGDTTISQKTAKALFRGMAIKDEYEVARLHTVYLKEELLKEFDCFSKLPKRNEFRTAIGLAPIVKISLSIPPTPVAAP